MFDFSLSELGVVGVVALIALGPKELVSILRGLRDLHRKIISFFTESKSLVNKVLDEEEHVVDVIMDMDGKYQKTYDVKKFTPTTKDE